MEIGEICVIRQVDRAYLVCYRIINNHVYIYYRLNNNHECYLAFYHKLILSFTLSYTCIL